MEWKGRRESSNVEDARGQSSGGGGGLGLLMTIGRVFGFKGILIALVVGGVLWMAGIVDPGALLGNVIRPSGEESARNCGSRDHGNADSCEHEATEFYTS